MELSDQERLRHVYVIGRTGSGKSTLLEQMAQADIDLGDGVCFIDPHGQTAERLTDNIPAHRTRETCYLDPSDSSPVAFNPLYGSTNHALTTTNLISAFKSRWWADAEYPFTEWVLFYTIMALLERPNATLRDISKALTTGINPEPLRDPETRRFWRDQWPLLTKKDQQEVSRSINNKLGQFLGFPTIRKLLTSTPRFDLKHCIDNSGILIVNLAKGRIGEAAAATLGSLILSTIKTHAFARTTTHPFWLYVDEWQSFGAPIFEDMLAEIRKFNVGLTLANQSLAQLPRRTQSILRSNTGTVVVFRVSPEDAEIFAPDFEVRFKTFEMTSLTDQEPFHALCNSDTRGKFAYRTTAPRQTRLRKHKVIRSSRERFAS